MGAHSNVLDGDDMTPNKTTRMVTPGAQQKDLLMPNCQAMLRLGKKVAAQVYWVMIKEVVWQEGSHHGESALFF